jgi:hypothetical protein
LRKATILKQAPDAIFALDLNCRVIACPAGAAWKTKDLRLCAIRLAPCGLRLMQGGYPNLLHSPRRRRE